MIRPSPDGGGPCRSDLSLTDSGLETEMLFVHGLDLPHFAAFVLLRDPVGRERLARYFRAHVELARALGLGTVLETPTWRASADWGDLLGYDAEALAAANADAVALVREAVDGAVDAAGPTVPVVVSGNLGPRGDGYAVTSTMTVEEAAAYHRPQVEALAGAGAHRVTALTMTYVEEAAGDRPRRRRASVSPSSSASPSRPTGGCRRAARWPTPWPRSTS